GDGTFTDRAAEWGVAIAHSGSAGVAGDFDGDGRVDLFVTSLGDPSQITYGQHRLYRNDASGVFVDVTAGSGVNVDFVAPATSSRNGWGGAWGDYDLDGDLDLAIAQWTGLNHLLRNDGAGIFTDQTAAAGVATSSPNILYGYAPRFVDMDGDRYPEITWIGDFTSGRYFVNNTDGTFADATAASNTMLGGTEMGTTCADFDRDSRFDFYVTTINANNLYLNQGSHVFSQVATTAGVRITGWGWGAISPDVDHNGWPDIIATGQNGQFAFLNQGVTGEGLVFTDVSLSLGIRGQSVDNGRGVANLDYDNDGDQDVVVFQYNGALKLYRNDLTGEGDTHWLRVFLDTSAAGDIAPNGVGSVVKVTTGGFTQTGRIDAGSNYLSQSEMSAHFGLGTATVIDELRVEWTNGDVTIMNNVAADQTITIAASGSPLLGDMNCDAVVNLADIAPFAMALTDAAGYAIAYPACDINAADLDASGAIDGRDVAAFVVELLN
ncbi:MAG: CRTAC1 family protein, partial [Phycisphaerales bacterium]|nr:CRTAC1 family protein [Phycisphaerales bacterium]